MKKARYLLDSDILIEYSHLNNAVLSFIEKNYQTCRISVLSYSEVLSGARNKQELRVLKELLEPFEIVYFNLEIQKIALKILELNKLKTGIGLADCLIAASAIQQNLTLVTNNLKHFKYIPNISLSAISGTSNR